MRRLLLLLLATAWCSSYSGCVSPPMIAGGGEVTHVGGVEAVVLLPPAVDCRSVDTGEPCTLDPALARGMAEAAAAAFRSAVGERVRHVTLADLGGVNPEGGEALGLFRSAKAGGGAPADARRLAAFAAADSATHILGVHVRVFAGSGASWDPMSGAIATGSSRITMEAALYAAAPRETVWTRIAQARASPEQGDDATATLSRMLLESLALNRTPVP